MRSTGRHVSDEGLSRVREIPPGAVMVTCIASIGKLGIAAERCCTNQQINSVIAGDSVISEYLYYAMSFASPSLLGLAGTTAVPIVSKSKFSAYRVMVPPLPEQRRIAATLSSVDDAIEKTQAAVDQAQVVKRGVMQELFTRGLPGRHTRFKKTEVGELPEEWMAMTLADAATVVGGGTPSKNQSTYWNGDVPWATPTDITGLGGRFISETAASITEAGLASSSATLLPPNSLLMTTRATIGACAINRGRMATNQGFQSLVPNQTCVVDFLYYFVQYHRRRLERLAAGSTFLEVSNRTVREFRVHLPHVSEQHRIASVLSSMDDAIEITMRLIDGLQLVKRGLLASLLTGEIRVRADTEPA